MARFSVNEDRMRSIFAEELDRVGERGLAEAVRMGRDNSHGGTAALAAMKRAVEESVDGP